MREWWKDDKDQRRVFAGKVKSVKGASGTLIAIPENFEVFFWRTKADLADLRVGQDVLFTVGFNAHGSIAERVRQKP